MDKIIKLTPAIKDYVWGGEKLKKYGKHADTNIAETWELSFHKDGLCLDENGTPLRDAVSYGELGENVKDFPFFPMLIKLIDAKDNLSVQVHPSDEYALKNEGQFGKTEMWYVIEADEGAGLYLGLKKDVTPEEFALAIENNTVLSLLNFVKVQKGDHYFIKSGTVHAIGKGCTICEIQQNSNLTYRVYDYDRRDKNGNARPLHIEKAKAVANLRGGKPVSVDISEPNDAIIGCSKYFTVRYAKIDGSLSFTADKDSFFAVTFVSGSGDIDGKKASAGDTFFVPANYGKFTVSGNAEVILSCVEKYFATVSKDDISLKAEVVSSKGNVVAAGIKRIEQPDLQAEKTCLLNKILLPIGMDTNDLSEIKTDF